MKGKGVFGDDDDLKHKDNYGPVQWNSLLMRVAITVYCSEEGRKEREIGETPLKNGIFFTEVSNVCYKILILVAFLLFLKSIYIPCSI